MIMYDVEPTLVWQRATVWPWLVKNFPQTYSESHSNDDFDHFAGVTFAWTEEGGEKADTQPEFGLVELIAHELSGYSELTNTLLEDSVINLINFLTRLFRSAWYWYTDKEFIRGTGGKKPLGIINDPGIIQGNLRALPLNFKMYWIWNLRFLLFMTLVLCGLLPKKVVRLFVDKLCRLILKNLVLQESFKELADGYSMTILGRPAFLAGKLPALGQAGDIILGNWSNYYVGFRQDFSMDSAL